MSSSARSSRALTVILLGEATGGTELSALEAQLDVGLVDDLQTD